MHACAFSLKLRKKTHCYHILFLLPLEVPGGELDGGGGARGDQQGRGVHQHGGKVTGSGAGVVWWLKKMLNLSYFPIPGLWMVGGALRG